MKESKKNFPLKSGSSWFWISIVLIFVIYFVRLLMVGTYGDDFMYKKVAISDFPQIIQFMKWHIARCNGRTLVHCFVILFLRNKVTTVIWKILTAFLIPFFCYEIAGITTDNTKSRQRCTIFMLIVFQLVGTIVYCESIYWVSGSFNYFYPTVGVLFALCLYIKNPKSVWLIPVSLLIGATTEQVGVMAVGLFVLLFIDRLIKTKKIDIRLLIMVLLSVVGYLLVVLAPGTNSRIEKQGNISFDSVIYNMFVVFRTNWFASIFTISVLFFLTIAITYWLIELKNLNRITGKLNKFLTVFLVLGFIFNLAFIAISKGINIFFASLNFPKAINYSLFAIWVVYVIVFFLSFMYTSIMIYIDRKNVLPFISFALGTGSQMVMGITPRPLYRACIQAVIMYMIFLAYTFSDIENKGITLKRIRINKSFFKKTAAVFCVLLSVIQSVALSYFMSPGYPTDLGEMKPMTSEETTIMTDTLYKGNIEYYQKEWSYHIDLFDFSQY